jgi:hypothetical protein
MTKKEFEESKELQEFKERRAVLEYWILGTMRP